MSAEAQEEPKPLEAVEQGSGPARRHARRLEDKLLIAFHHACDVNDLEVAGHVLRVLELMLSRRVSSGDNARRRNMENLVAAYERIWHIRHKGS